MIQYRKCRETRRRETRDKETRRQGDEERKVVDKIIRHQDLVVYRKAFEVSMRIFDLSKGFPREETYSLTDQIRRSSRSVPANIAEAWRKRKYAAAFAAKLNDAEGEAAETETWIEYAVRCEYLNREKAKELFLAYEEVIAMLVSMRNKPEQWILS